MVRKKKICVRMAPRTPFVITQDRYFCLTLLSHTHDRLLYSTDLLTYILTGAGNSSISVWYDLRIML